MECSLQGITEESGNLNINGPAADNWGAGVVFYELLTGALLLVPNAKSSTASAPEQVPVAWIPEYTSIPSAYQALSVIRHVSSILYPYPDLPR